MEINKISQTRNFGMAKLTKQAKEIAINAISEAKDATQKANIIKNLNDIASMYTDYYVHAFNFPNKTFFHLTNTKNRFLGLLEFNIIGYKPMYMKLDKKTSTTADMISTIANQMKKNIATNEQQKAIDVINNALK